MVDLQTAIDEINTGKIEFDYKDDNCCTTEGEVVILLKRLAELEKADVVEVKQGYWKLCEDDSLICATEFVCSVCGESFCSSELTDKQMLEMMKYCSNCGAKMRGDAE